jgi:hypothetical protein
VVAHAASAGEATDPFDEGVRAGAIGTTIALVILGLCAVGIWTIAHGVWP